MRTEFPAMHTSLARPPRSPDREKRSRNRRAALATRGVFFVRPKSERTSSLQFVATYFGRYSSNADEPGFTHCPDGCWPRRICAAKVRGNELEAARPFGLGPHEEDPAG